MPSALIVNISHEASGAWGLPLYPPAEVSGLWSLSLAAGLIGLCVVLLMVGAALVNRRLALVERLTRHSLAWLFGAVWLLCFVVYETGMYTGHPASLIGSVPMAMLHAFGAFVLASDVSAVNAPFVSDWAYMAAFSLAHFLAAATSMLFVVKHFGFSINSRMRMMAEGCLRPAKDATFLFWGFDDAAYALAGDIKHHLGDGNYRIIVARKPSARVAESGDPGGAIERLMGGASISEQDLDRLQELDCLATTVAPEGGLNKPLRRIITRKTLGELHIFLLGDDEKSNIRQASMLAFCPDIVSWAQASGRGSRQAVIHCQAALTNANRAVADGQHAPRVEVRLLDTAHLGVELLKRSSQLLPVNFVDAAPDGSVTTPFSALIAGFGPVGQEALRFLYEHAAFCTPPRSDGHRERSAFRCHVVDSDMPNLQGGFLTGCPALRADTSVTFEQADCRSTAFYRYVEQNISTLQYVVLATGDDDRNMALALHCLRQAQRQGADVGRLCVLVNIKSDTDGRFARISAHYNRIAHAESHAPGHRLHQREVKSNQECSGPIHLFGTKQDIFTYGMIVDQSLLQEAKRYKEQYDLCLPPAYRQSWQQEQSELLQLADGPWRGYAPTLSALTRLRRVQSQNMANSLHSATKRILARRALGEEAADALPGLNLKREEGSTTYLMPDGSEPAAELAALLDTLAQTEHLRWMAAHILLGYLPAPDIATKNEAAMLHGCLAPWGQLTPRLRSYDCNVVDVALGITNKSPAT